MIQGGGVALVNDNLKKFPDCLGRLWSNLLSLEVIMRLCILRKRGQGSSTLDLATLTEGTTVEENALTNYDSLGKVIDKFNSEFTKENWITEKEKIVRLRDALAHGRFISSFPSPIKFYKFSKPKAGKVNIELIEELTIEWFDINIKLISKDIRRIHKIYQNLKKD